MDTSRSRLPWIALALVMLLGILVEPFAIQAARLAAEHGDGAVPDPAHHGHVAYDHTGGHAPFGLEGGAYKAGAEGSETVEVSTPLLGTLGSHHFAITTTSPLAQRYFDEGLVLAYGFNHERAIASFQAALTLDPACAICHWGIAYSLGPNINMPMADSAVPVAYAALQRAIELAPGASDRERAYVRALAARYSPEPADRAALDLAYADAMRDLARQYPDDQDAATLFAEALMDLTPWAYWTNDGQATVHTDEIVRTLESVLARDPNHPGANHFYIHAVEASHTPERALPSAERLTNLTPGAGHLVHMPAHIYWRVGRYGDAARINVDAIHSDETHAVRVGGTPDQNAHTFYSLAYYPHNIHFLFAATQMEGRSTAAIEAAGKLTARIPEAAFREVPAIEDFRTMPLMALARFGRWEEILREPAPPADLQYSVGLSHWARGLAFTRLGRLADANAELEQLEVIAATDAMGKQMLMSNASAVQILDIAANVLAGELAGARGRHDEMIVRLERAVELQDTLSYMEPPAWYYPVRHNLGAALLQVGRAADAEAVYREDLRQYPKNGWALFGLAESLQAQGKGGPAAMARQAFQDAWTNADAALTSSRF